MQSLADVESKIASAEEKGVEKGLEQGINMATKNIALNLIKKGTAIEIIAEVTGLSIAYIKQIVVPDEFW